MSLKRGLQYLARSPTRKAVTPAALVAAGYPAAGAEDPETYARKLSAVDPKHYPALLKDAEVL